MAGKPKRMSQIKQLLRLHKDGYSIKGIARNLLISKNTVKTYLKNYESSKFNIETLLSMDETILEKIFHPVNPAYKDTQFEEIKSSLDYYAKELKHRGVTKKLLWEEYRLKNSLGYSLSQFSFHLQQHLLNKNPSMVLQHEPCEKLFVDFAGKKLSFIDRDTGEYYFALKLGSTSWANDAMPFELAIDELSLTKERVAPATEFKANVVNGIAPVTFEFTDKSAYATS